MDNALKHLEKLKKQIDIQIGEGKAEEILSGLDLSGSESNEEIALWANELTKRLEDNVSEEKLIKIREECACIKANKYTQYKKYFKEIREKHPTDDKEYLKAIVEFLNGRGRCGKKVEFVDDRIISTFGFSKECSCYVVKGWEKPPSITWCRCCQGSLFSIYKHVFPDKKCNMDIIETFANGGSDCVFETWYTDKE